MSRTIDRIPVPKHPREKKVIVLSYPRYVPFAICVDVDKKGISRIGTHRQSRCRNGTLGLYKAFTILGYNPYHLVSCWEHGVDHIRIAREGLEARLAGKGKPFGRDEFDKWFSENGTVMDVAAFFAADLIKAYPDAKFILTYRDPKSWMRSVENTIMKVEMSKDDFPLRYMRMIDTYTDEIFKLSEYLGMFIWKRTLHDDKNLRSKERAIEGYEKHNEMVRKLVPPEQLLEVKLEDGLGWEQICPFIGEPIPDVPYPRSNDPQEFKKLVQGLFRSSWTKILITYATTVLVPVIGGTIWYLRQRK
ncbi:hypothetical protein jhhlp_007864 [Lomentospora prolificans]|uniref:Sulfotransferase domain-containing protein n=1 Tax=Lomentospora prolificans TaxID=41688 RepID=A0A2N3N0S4_9PEZI|nr:hypothetical protein jhhlp_007864 [Lomentospora prolificans]